MFRSPSRGLSSVRPEQSSLRFILYAIITVFFLGQGLFVLLGTFGVYGYGGLVFSPGDLVRQTVAILLFPYLIALALSVAALRMRTSWFKRGLFILALYCVHYLVMLGAGIYTQLPEKIVANELARCCMGTRAPECDRSCPEINAAIERINKDYKVYRSHILDYFPPDHLSTIERNLTSQ